MRRLPADSHPFSGQMPFKMEAVMREWIDKATRIAHDAGPSENIVHR
jgi:hypothetical protein